MVDEAAAEPLLRFERLGVRFGATTAVRDLSLAVRPGETAGIVGESGSGKSVAMLAALGLLPPGAAVTGSIRFAGQELVGLGAGALDTVRGRSVTIVFQEPQSALDPLFTVGTQIGAVLRRSKGLGRRAATARAIELLDETGLDEPRRRARAYPHELSGGQRQRVAIAMAMAPEPRLLIADEPTTALDSTVAARILELLADLKRRHGMALVLISHDLGLVRRVSDSVHVMERGRVIEGGATAVVTGAPRDPYTRKLLAAEHLPPAPPRPIPAGEPLLRAQGVLVRYPLRGGSGWRGLRGLRPRSFVAVDDVSLTIAPGETLGIIGESGSGKSTLGRALLRLEPAEGSIRFEGRELRGLGSRAMRPLRRDLQMVFQDPFSSLSPRLTLGEIIGEGLRVHEPCCTAAERGERVASALREVGLPVDFAGRRPHELSGGQRQRVGIARAMILSPRLVVLDEPTSALDRSVQAEVVALLRRLQEERALSYLFITHDLAVVRALAGRIAVMHRGRIVETGPAAAILEAPRDGYTRQLVAAAALN